MDKQNVILKTHELEVIGQGPMVYEPCQVGEWWVMPVEQYTGTIPPEVMKKWDDFKLYAQFFNIKVTGYLVGDDMRDVLIKREKAAQEQREREAEAERQRQAEADRARRKEGFDRAVKKTAEVGGMVLGAVGTVAVGVATGAAMVVGGLLMAALRFDPILIAVCDDGRWVCIAAWWD